MPGGGTTAVVVEPDDAAHTVHFVFNTTVASNSEEPKTFEEVLNMDNMAEQTRWTKPLQTEVENFFVRGSWSKYPRAKVKEEGRKIIRTKLVFKKKIEAEGSKAPDTYGVRGHGQ